LDNARAEEEAFDIISFVKIDGKPDHLFGLESRSRHIGGAAVDAIRAIPNADVGEQKLKEGYASAIGRVAVADSHTLGIADSVNVALPVGTARRA
jgi:hypothetical protein